MICKFKRHNYVSMRSAMRSIAAQVPVYVARLVDLLLFVRDRGTLAVL